MKKFLLPLFLIAAFPVLNAQQAPLPADTILKEACTVAAKENKKVFIMFHASWCGWCHKMDASMNDKNCKQFFDDNFVIRHLVVFESKGKENLENPGALEMLKKYKAENDGIPYWLVYDKDGKLLADSRIRPEGAALNEVGKNMGCPASKEEVDQFIKVLKGTTSLNEEQLAIIEKRFRQNEH